jgi:4-oxalocrotonate tautomerase family enzyme
MDMPIVRVEMLAGRPPEIKQALAAELTAVVARHLGNDPAHIYVMFSDVAHRDWAVAGRVFESPSTGSGQAVPAGSDT